LKIEIYQFRQTVSLRGGCIKLVVASRKGREGRKGNHLHLEISVFFAAFAAFA